ncbi:MAG: DUF817 domain-containing protein [Sphingomonadales bacterium]|nr:DUF817 domain-containing protein [Sphingomonadales bacterium]MDE2170215.1 DUF817 domain-containing protein [Sphingomonadales bacterium]
MQHTRFQRIRLAVEAYAPPPGWRSWLYEFLLFGFKQGWACLFGGLVLALLLATRLWWPIHAPIARYDALTIAALAIQLAMLGLRLETWDEARVILAFHVVGTAMELFKTAVGSWTYPEPGLLRLGGVPLFSGFMYAAVGSYMARVWRIFHFRFTAYPSRRASRWLAVIIYVNFFTHHWLPDVRWLCFGAMGWMFARTRVWFRMWQVHRWMPLLLGWLLVALFIWFAENLATFSHAWLYPSQRHGWSMVSPEKLGAWLLLMYVSFVLVEGLHARRDQ